jgi:hypothetical protein
MIFLVPAKIPNANAIQGVPYNPQVKPCGSGTMCTYELDVNGTHYAIRYLLMFLPTDISDTQGIVLSEIRVMPQDKSIVLNVTVATRGHAYIMFILPRSLIDATNSTNNEVPFAVLDNGSPLGYCIGFILGCSKPGTITESSAPVADTFEGYGINEDPAKFRSFSLWFYRDSGIHGIEMIGTTIAPEFPFASTLLIISGILMALILAAVRFARISRFPPQ